MKTGPKPKTGKELALKHEERLDYKLLRVLDDKKFKVRCRSCELIRIVDLTGAAIDTSKHQCFCKKKKLGNNATITPEIHTLQLRNRGHVEYECLKLGGNNHLKTSNTYRHECGHQFKMTYLCFEMCKVPCYKCRQRLELNGTTLSTKQYTDRVRKRTKYVKVLGEYQGVTTPIVHQNLKCGHKYLTTPDLFYRNQSPSKCPVCCPFRVWFRFKLQNCKFKTRSAVEKKFVKQLVQKGKAVASDIEYEPKEVKVKYWDPNRNEERTYSPDFKIKDVLVEVKDLASLGLKEYHWQDKDEALIENRAKYEAAVAKFDDYRLYVHIKGRFFRAYKFWTKKEQQRLLNI